MKEEIRGQNIVPVRKFPLLSSWQLILSINEVFLLNWTAVTEKDDADKMLCYTGSSSLLFLL